MASGKKNYFRHSNSAFDDEKIQKCIQLLGYQGYAYYFILLELLAKQCENSFKNPITIHQQSLRNVWRKQAKSCKKVVEKLQESGLFVATFKESFVEFDIPNLSKYMGKYETKFHPNSPNKRKEKEIKEKEKKRKEIKENIGDIDLEFIAQCWNDVAIKHGLQTCPMVLGGKILESVFVINTHLKNNAVRWEEYFDLLGRSDFLKNKKGSPLNLTWALNEENLFKALSGAFNDEFKTGHSRENPYLAELRKLEAKNGK